MNVPQTGVRKSYILWPFKLLLVCGVNCVLQLFCNVGLASSLSVQRSPVLLSVAGFTLQNRSTRWRPSDFSSQSSQKPYTKSQWESLLGTYLILQIRSWSERNLRDSSHFIREQGWCIMSYRGARCNVSLFLWLCNSFCRKLESKVRFLCVCFFWSHVSP